MRRPERKPCDAPKTDSGKNGLQSFENFFYYKKTAPTILM